MKKKKELEQKRIPTQTIDEILRIIKDEYLDFQKTTDTGQRMEHMMEVFFGTFLYLLSRYDFENLVKMREDK